MSIVLLFKVAGSPPRPHTHTLTLMRSLQGREVRWKFGVQLRLELIN
jgi:hypothetical protein